MKALIKGTLLAAVMALFVVPKAHANVNLLTVCQSMAAGNAPTVVTLLSQGKLTPDSNGCIVFDQAKDVSARDLDTLVHSGWIVKGGYIPWGSTAPLQQSSATPTFTYTATALAGINQMTANETSLTLAGMTAGKYYLAIFVQDGTGGRTLTQTAISGAPGLLPSESGANQYAVWLIKATSASAATFVVDYPNRKLFDVWTSAINSAGTALSATATQAQTAQVVPGLANTNTCTCSPATLGSNWTTGISTFCVAATNSATCEIANAGAGTPTPAAVSLNTRIFQ